MNAISSSLAKRPTSKAPNRCSSAGLLVVREPRYESVWILHRARVDVMNALSCGGAIVPHRRAEPGPQKRGASKRLRSGGKVVYLDDFDASSLSLAEFIKARMRHQPKLKAADFLSAVTSARSGALEILSWRSLIERILAPAPADNIRPMQTACGQVPRSG